MATQCDMSQTAIARIWQAFALQPHRVETFKLSKDPLFIDKVRDIVGLYLNPPDKALLLSVDEKSQIQALDRTAPMLPMRPGQPERRTHDYTRHGTTSLFAALDWRAVESSANCISGIGPESSGVSRHHRRAVPAHLDLHLIVDNAAPTRRRACADGWRAIRAFMCISPRPAHRGSTWSSAGSRR